MSRCPYIIARSSPIAREAGSGFLLHRYLPNDPQRVKERSAMLILCVIDPPAVQSKLTELRHFSSDHRKFRALLDEIAMLMVYDVTRDWPTKPMPTQTPLEQTIGQVLARQVTLVP